MSNICTRFISSLYSYVRQFSRQEAGVSLIEAAVGLTVLGLFAVPVLNSFKQEAARESFFDSYRALSIIQYSLNQYVLGGEAAYACPADLQAQLGDANFGVAGDCTLASIPECTDASWFTTDGYCKTDNTSNAIIIGGVPFSDLNLLHDQTIDSFGNKIIYAVTHTQTSDLTFQNEGGGKIDVMSVDDPSDGMEDGVPDLITKKFDFFLFSTGVTGVGSISKDGTLNSVCGTPADGYDHENCDFDRVFFTHTNPDDRDESARSNVAGVTFFDDITLAQEHIPQDIWYQHEDNNLYPNYEFAQTFANRIGIGTQNPEETIEIIGDARAQSRVIPLIGPVGGSVKSDAICREGESNCFDPVTITGTEPDMQCDHADQLFGAQAVVKLAHERFDCISPLDIDGNIIDGDFGMFLPPSFSAIDCTGGVNQIAKGFNAGGDVICD